MINLFKLDVFTTAYIECALWSSVDNEGCALDENYCDVDITAACLTQMVDDCIDFQNSNAELISKSKLDESQCGNDFWLTRNRHGSGFWDRGNVYGKELTEAARMYGGFDLYVGDDFKIYY